MLEVVLMVRNKKRSASETGTLVVMLVCAPGMHQGSVLSMVEIW
jgi:hypothetical protein